MKENNNLSLSDLNDSAILRENESLLSLLLKDHTTGKNIKWGTDSYINHGYSFRDDQEIKIDLITGWYEGFIRPRVDKDIDIQLERQRNRAEVFTPSWVIKLQVDAALKDLEELSLVDFIKTKWLEITCGEAPYMVNRYDMETGEVIPLKDRSGFIDVKFKKLNQEIEPEEEWLKLAVEIYKASYGYEYQGDSLLLARENLILTFIDNYFYMFGAFPKDKLLKEITNIISLNVFQMDGLTYEVPYSDGGFEGFGTQLSLFEEVEVEKKKTAKLANIKLWDKNKIIEFKKKSERNDVTMKFDVVIGNPPYQLNDNGKRDDGAAQNASASPIYDSFILNSQDFSKIQNFIIPSRWAFGAGKGLKEFKETMMADKHIQSFTYYENSREVFPNNEIKGGVCIFSRNKSYKGEAKITLNLKSGVKIQRHDYLNTDHTGMLIIHNEMASIVKKLNEYYDYNFSSINNIKSGRNPYGLPTSFFKSPQKVGIEKVYNEKNKQDDIAVYGLGKSQARMTKYISNNEKINKGVESIDTWKVFTPYAYGNGDFGEAMSNPFVAGPSTVCTETFLQFGSFDSEFEAISLLKYIKTKFFRALVSILKVTQHSTTTYDFVPMQIFTKNSDINWNQSISKIDQQLYEKYGLNEDEIIFIETHVKEME